MHFLFNQEVRKVKEESALLSEKKKILREITLLWEILCCRLLTLTVGKLTKAASHKITILL